MTPKQPSTFEVDREGDVNQAHNSPQNDAEPANNCVSHFPVKYIGNGISGLPARLDSIRSSRKTTRRTHVTRPGGRTTPNQRHCRPLGFRTHWTPLGVREKVTRVSPAPWLWHFFRFPATHGFAAKVSCGQPTGLEFWARLATQTRDAFEEIGCQLVTGCDAAGVLRLIQIGAWRVSEMSIAPVPVRWLVQEFPLEIVNGARVRTAS